MSSAVILALILVAGIFSVVKLVKATNDLHAWGLLSLSAACALLWGRLLS